MQAAIRTGVEAMGNAFGRDGLRAVPFFSSLLELRIISLTFS